MIENQDFYICCSKKNHFLGVLTMLKKLHIGIGAQYTVKVMYLHPEKLVSKTIINSTAHTEVTALLVIKEERRKVNKKEQQVIVFRHDLIRYV